MQFIISRRIVWTMLLMIVGISINATHYVNRTGKYIKITNVSAKQGKQSWWHYFNRKKNQPIEQPMIIYFLELAPEQEGDLDNRQGDEITITSDYMSDKRKLFPTNNAFNYVITLNTYGKKYEQFDINRAGNDDEMKKHSSQKKTSKAEKKAAKRVKKKQKQQAASL